MIDSFSTFHPIVNFTYFVAVLLFSMFFMHPIFLGIAFTSAFTYSIMLKGKRAIRFNILYMMPMLLFMAILNPLLNHKGTTILFYLKSGNPITLESVLYGATAAFMFITIILWFLCYNEVMTSDKFIYLFGKTIPALSLIFSMVLRFIPRYKAKIKEISDAQKCIGRDVSQGDITGKARNGIRILSIMTTWALENAIETADSMGSRGYGLPGRTNFSLFRFDNRDKIALIVIIGLIIVVLFGAVMRQNTVRFFPSIKLASITGFSVTVYIAYFVLCMLPVIIDILEEFKWRYIESKI